MTSAQRLERYLRRQLDLLASYGELQGKIQGSIRAGAADALAAQAGAVRALTAQIAELQRACDALAPGAGDAGLEALEAALVGRREAALEANRANRALLGGAMEELRRQLQELRGRPRTAPSPFTKIGRPVLVDLHS